mmetsp:Transcript_10062/g.42315  ORF Transcript_10062/g.42315 Transcript_10062/m.42315 type:complete len:919 (-) Transcript_10062:22-2778(-)
MVKAYLRYQFDKSFGVVAGVRCGSEVLEKGEELRRRYGNRVNLAVSPAVETVLVWNLRSGSEVARFVNDGAREAGEVTSLSAYGDGTRVAAGYADGSIRTWSIVESKLEGIFNGHVTAVTSLAWANGGSNPEGETLFASGSADGEVVLWDPAAEKGRFRIHGAHSNEITALRVIAGHIITASKDGLLKIYEISTQSCVQTVVGHPGEVWSMDVGNDLLVTGSIDQDIRVWKLVDATDRNGIKLTPLGSFEREGSSRCICLRFNKAGTMLLGHGTEKSIQLFHVRNETDAKKHRRRRRARREAKSASNDQEDQPAGDLELEAVDFFHHARSVKTDYKVRSASFLENQQNLRIMVRYSDFDSSVARKRAHLRNHSVYRQVHMHHNLLEVLEIGLGHGGTLKSVMLVDKPGDRGDIRSLTMTSDDSALLSLSSAKTLKVWNPVTGVCLRTIETVGYGLCCKLIAAEKFVVAGFKAGQVQIFDFSSGVEVCLAETAHNGSVWGIDVPSSDDGFVTCGSDKKVKFWSLAEDSNGKFSLVPKRILELNEDVLCMRITNDSKYVLVSLLDSTVRAFYLDSLKPFLTFYGHKLPVLSLDVSSDGTMLATGSADKSVKLWGLDFGDCRKSLRAHDGSVMTVVFQPDTHMLFSGSRDGTLKYWDADKFELITEMTGQRSEVWTCTTSADGEIVVSGSHDRSVRVWKRSDEMMFIEDEKNKRLDAVLEGTLQEDERQRRSSGAIVPEVVPTDTSLAGRRTLDAIAGGDKLLEALELGELEKLRREEEPSEPPSVELVGLSAEDYVLRVLKNVRRADLEATLQLLPLKQATMVLTYCVSWLKTEAASCVDIELVYRAVMYIVHTHQDQIVSGGNRSLVSSVSGLLRARVNRHRDNIGFNLEAMRFVLEENRTLDSDLFGLSTSSKRPRIK